MRGGDDVLGVPHPVLRCCFHPERERVLARKHTPHAIFCHVKNVVRKCI